MKLLGLLRHAKSEWDDMAKRDFDRTLNDRGRKGAGVIGAHIKSHGIVWDTLIASPAERVKRTIEVSLPTMEPVFDDRLYLASSETILETIEEHGGAHDKVLISGHNPGLQEVVFDLVSPARENDLFKEAAVKFPTATYAVLECAIDDWSQLKKHCASLVHFARPRDLDPDLGPEY